MKANILFTLGALLLILGVAAMLPITPVETMDCGCGKAANCDTKQFSVLLGSILLATGALSATAATVIRVRRRAS